MRYRPIQFNDGRSYPEHGRATPSLLETLIDLGLPEENAKRAEASIVVHEMEVGREYLRRFLEAMPPEATVMAVIRAMFGSGCSLSDDAAKVKRSRSSLHREVQHVRKHARSKSETAGTVV